MSARLRVLFSIAVFALCVGARQIVEWTRKLDTCDPEDRPIGQGATRLVLSMNDERPDGPDSLKPHGPKRRGQTSARMHETGREVPLPPDVQHFDVVMPQVNVTFYPNHPDTAYWCTGFKLPTFEKKVHIVRWEPVLQEDNIDVLHHMLVYECPTMTDADVSLTGDCGYGGGGFPDRMMGCLGATTIGAWAVGGQAMDLPLDVGLPLFPNAPRYFLIQTHYNKVDPNRRPIVDSSGMRFYYTSTLRKHEGGIMDVGLVTNPAYTIPPGQPAYVHDTSCPGECTKAGLDHPITLISTLLHAHNIGSKMLVRHWRQGVELPVIMRDDTYDFNFQDFESNAAGTVIMPGDEIQATCTYDSTTRKDTTFFGLSSQEEMCLVYFIYYPRVSAQYQFCLNAYKDPADPKDRIVWCFGQQFDVNVNHTYPLPPPTCDYKPVDPARQKPTMFNAADFDPSKYQRKSSNQVDGKKFDLYWTIDQQTEEIHFAADVETNGWFGVGISKNGGMPGSDIMTAHVFKNVTTGQWQAQTVYGVMLQPVVRDRMATAYAKPPADKWQDLYDIRVSYPAP